MKLNVEVEINQDWFLNITIPQGEQVSGKKESSSKNE